MQKGMGNNENIKERKKIIDKVKPIGVCKKTHIDMHESLKNQVR